MSRSFLQIAVLFLVMTGVVGLIATGQVSAVESATTEGDSGSIAISPATKKVSAAAGGVVNETFTVINDGNAPYKFIVYARPYSVVNEQYEPQFEKTSATTAVFQWISFPQVAFEIGPGERIDVPYSIRVPAQAGPGGYYGVIFAETQPDSSATSSVLRKKRVGGIILASVAGKTVNEGALKSVSADFWQHSRPLVAHARVANTGNIDFTASVAMSVKDMFGATKYVQKKDYIIYPDTTRDIKAEWRASPWFGLFKVEQTVSFLGKTSDHSHYVLLAPRWLLVLLVIVVVAGVGYIVRGAKRSS